MSGRKCRGSKAAVSKASADEPEVVVGLVSEGNVEHPPDPDVAQKPKRARILF